MPELGLPTQEKYTLLSSSAKKLRKKLEISDLELLLILQRTEVTLFTNKSIPSPA